MSRFRRSNGVTLLEVLIGIGVLSLGFLGALSMVVQSGKLASAAEEDGLASSALEQRMDQMRTLSWSSLTDGTGIRTTVWTARPLSMTGITVTQETMTVSSYNLTNAQVLTATWNGTSTSSANLSTATNALNSSSAVKVVATLTWTARRTARSQTRSLVTVISKGGVSEKPTPTPAP
ncbi:MAG TPA: prepilin-type N-terminal cleavage/methylation domain-containing protein [Chthoniobacterales bacterium]|jgi:Tfp pilus assembly protein PilV